MRSIDSFLTSILSWVSWVPCVWRLPRLILWAWQHGCWHFRPTTITTNTTVTTTTNTTTITTTNTTTTMGPPPQYHQPTVQGYKKLGSKAATFAVSAAHTDPTQESVAWGRCSLPRCIAPRPAHSSCVTKYLIKTTRAFIFLEFLIICNLQYPPRWSLDLMECP